MRGGGALTFSAEFPDPFAVVTVDGEQTHTTSVIRKTLNPYWNESFDMYVFSHRYSSFLDQLTVPVRRVSEASIVAVQIFDQKKFKKKDQGFLGVINIRVGDVLDLSMGNDGLSR